jgi:hypothetical protein
MQKTNTENTYKYLQPGKIKQIYKILVLFEKSGLRNLGALQKPGGFEKSWRFYKNQTDFRNLGALQKDKRIYKILALYRKTGGR